MTMGRIYAGDVLWKGQWQLWRPFWAENSIYMLTGALVVFLGPALPAVTSVFALLSFWGDYFFYRAAALVVSEADRGLVALLMFLFPSLVFWPACIGKDAVMTLFLGMAVWGFALLNQRLTAKAICLFGGGLLGVAVVRPHVAAMLSIASILPFVLGRSRRGVPSLARIILAPALVACALYMAARAQDFLEVENLAQARGVVQQVGKNNNLGGSAFGGRASLAARAAAAPVLFFRPFPWEARSATSVIASAEGLLLLWLAWRRRRILMMAVRRWRSNPFSAFLLLFVIEFCLIYSAAITNFGLLARQRVMALPMVLILLMRLPAGDSPARAQIIVQQRSGIGMQRRLVTMGSI
jgi:hypothetical protein